jgi:hypothetical protein
MDCRIADELMAMAEHDRKVGDELAASGALYEGYDPRMAAVHEKKLEPDAHGNMRPNTIEDPDGVDERRRAVGLEPLAERLARAKPQPLLADRERFERDYQDWLIAVGWRTPPVVE